MKYFDFNALQPGSKSPLLRAEGMAACQSLPEAWAADCWRHVGWALKMVAGRGDLWDGGVDLLASCDSLGDPRASAACVEGHGFYLGDHFSFEPWKFHQLVDPGVVPLPLRLRLLRGIGYLLSHNYGHPPAAGHAC